MDADQEQAAIKIQALERGRRDRVKVKAQKQGGDGGDAGDAGAAGPGGGEWGGVTEMENSTPCKSG